MNSDPPSTWMPETLKGPLGDELVEEACCEVGGGAAGDAAWAGAWHEPFRSPGSGGDRAFCAGSAPGRSNGATGARDPPTGGSLARLGATSDQGLVVD